MKQLKNVLLILTLLFTALFIMACDGNGDGANDAGAYNDSTICTWLEDGNTGNYFIFFADSTVEYYKDKKLVNSRSTLKYEGSPTEDGTVRILTVSGTTLFSFSVEKTSNGVTAKELKYGLSYTVETSVGNESGKDTDGGADSGGDDNGIVCTYYMKDDTSVYYVFYGDKTAEYHANGKIINTRSELKYSGYPLKAGTVKLKISLTGTELISFNVKESNGTLIPIVELVPGFPVEYTLTLDDENNNGENSGTDNENKDDSGESGNDENGGTENVNTCKWVLDADHSIYFIFYPDNTVEYYSYDNLEYDRSTLNYEGNPTEAGTVTIKVNTGVPLFTFTVTKNGSSVTATENNMGLTYTMAGDSSNNGESGNDENGGTETPEEPSTDIDESPLMFMGFENVVTIENGTDITGITNTIYSLTSDTTLKFKGGINSITLTTIAAAIGTNDSVKIALDLSETTGITEWTNKLAGQKTLYAISLPGTVTSVQKDAFTGCTNLKAMTVPCSISSYPYKTVSYSPYISYYDGIIVNFSGTLADWLQSSVELPSGKRLYLNGETVSGTITIPDSVTSIRRAAFKNCSDITNVEIPDSVTSIGYEAFAECTSLTSITIPDSITSFGSSAFDGCSKLINVQIPTGVTRIEGWMFNNCTGLATVTIPDNITEIGIGAFYGCSRLTSITIPNSVTSIGSGAFDSCTTLKEVIIADGDEPLNLDAMGYGNHVATVFYACPLETLYLGRNLSYSTSDAEYSPFYYERTLTSVEIGETVTNIADYLFYLCTNLTAIYYHGTESQWQEINIADNAFSGTDINTIVYNYTGD